MTAVGAWTIGLAVAYTLFLVVVGLLARRKSHGGGFFVGGRGFSPLTVAVCITGLFSGSSFIAIVELSYHTGISAVWYGVAETTQVLLIALLMVVPFRERMVVTISGLIGERFGRLALGVGGAITAFTFPMWSVATAIAFASALYALTGLSMQLSIVFTALLLLFYLWAGGMHSIAFTQLANCVAFALMLTIGTIAFFINPGIDGLRDLAAAQPLLFDWTAVGMPLIVAWFGTFVVNVILAQAALQMALSCRTPAAGRKGLYNAAGFGLFFIVLGVLFGLAAAWVVPQESMGLVAVPLYISEVLPAPLAGVFLLGIWACALSWGAPCQFSGATSLGRDVARAIRPQATEQELVRYTRWSLVLLTALMVVFGWLRTEQSAWWNILAWTLRNGATLAPVVAALFWPLATRRAVVVSMLAGFASGMSWYWLSDWSPAQFYLGIHPVWVGMTANLAAMVLFTLAETAGRWRIAGLGQPGAAWSLGLAAVALGGGSACALNLDWLLEQGLLGLTGFTVAVSAVLTVILQVRPEDTPAAEDAALAEGAA